MGEFVPTRSRDAYGVIRGFVYQVDITIKRWLQLKGGQVLELERGEDIDTVIRALNGNEVATRQLEQVKYRERSLTLRSPEAVEAIANAIEHFDTNKNIVLSFQFTTNAVAGTERPNPFPKGGAAILVWEDIRAGRYIGAEADLALGAIKTLLASCQKPSSIPDQTWLLFRKVVDAPDNVGLLAIINAFSWCTRSSDYTSIKSSLYLELLEGGHATSKSVAISQYQRLFMHVLQLLTRPGLKQLRKADLPLALSPLDTKEQSALDGVFARLSDLEEKVDVLADRQVADRLEIEKIEKQFSELTQSHGMTAAVAYVAATPTLRPPRPPEHYSRRDETVSKLKPLLDQSVWLELIGGPGIGKSELARLLAGSSGGIRAWFDFRGLEEPTACVALDSGIRSVIGEYPPTERQDAYERFVRKGGSGVIVADDVPKIQAGKAFALRFLDLFNACRLSGVRLISTSLAPSPTWVQERIPANSSVLRPAPTFTDREAKELFQCHSAPAPWLADRIISLINGTAKGHPTLLVAGIRSLQKRRWQVTEEDFLNLMGGELFSDIRRESVQRLVDLIADVETRDLLYRLNCSFSALSEKEIHALAGVDKPIARSQERLQELIDICVQRAPNGNFRVSPFFQILGTSDVPARTVVACHSLLGGSIMARRTIGISDITSAITHFSAARDLQSAAIVLLRGLRAINQLDRKVDSGLLPVIWNDKPMPESIDLGLRIVIRANQMVLCRSEGKSVRYLMDDLDRLIKRAQDKDAGAVVVAGVTAQRALWDVDVQRANKLLLHSLRLMPVAKTEIGQRFDLGKVGLERLLWMNIRVKCIADLDSWITTVDALSSQQREKLFKHKVAAESCWHLADAVWLAEADKVDEQQQWGLVSDALIRLERASVSWGQSVLEACAIRARIVVLAEYQSDLSGAIALANQRLADRKLKGKAAFPIRECMGRQLMYQHRNEEAQKWLGKSLKDAAMCWRHQRIRTLMSLAKVSEPAHAVEWLIEANSEAHNDTRSSSVKLAQVHGELAIAEWFCNSRIETLRAADEAINHLVESKDQGDRVWRATLAAFGHCLGYFCTVIATGKEPEFAADGSPYAKPRLGMLFDVNLELADWLNNTRLSLLFSLVASMAEKLEQDEIANKRALQSLDMACQTNELLPITTMSASYSIGLVVSDRYSEALDLAMRSAEAGEAIAAIRSAGGDIHATDRTVEEILGPRPSPGWEKAELFAVVISVLPIMLRLATRAVQKSQDAASLAKEVISAVDIVIQSASDRELWTAIKDIFQQTFVDRVAGSTLVNFGNEQKNQNRITLQATAYIAASMQPDVDPRLALIGHLYVFAESAAVMPHDRPAYRRIAIPFLEAYWGRIFLEQSFRFSPPALYRDLFGEAKSQPINRRAQAILQLGFLGLHVPIPDKYRDWLRGAW